MLSNALSKLCPNHRAAIENMVRNGARDRALNARLIKMLSDSVP